MFQLLIVRDSGDVLVTADPNLHHRGGIYYVLMGNNYNGDRPQPGVLNDLACGHQLIKQGHVKIYQKEIRRVIPCTLGCVLSIVGFNYVIAVQF